MMTKNAQPAGIAVIPTSFFFAAPVLYAITYLLPAVFPIVGDLFLSPLLFLVLPCLLLLSLLVSGMRLLLAPPRTWPLIVAVLLNFLTTAFALLVCWMVMTFPEPD